MFHYFPDQYYCYYDSTAYSTYDGYSNNNNNLSYNYNFNHNTNNCSNNNNSYYFNSSSFGDFSNLNTAYYEQASPNISDSSTMSFYTKTSPLTISDETCLVFQPDEEPTTQTFANNECGQEFPASTSAFKPVAVKRRKQKLTALTNTDNNFSFAYTEVSENQTKTSKKEIQCEICGASSCGYHYGAFTCEACKLFFVRTTSSKKKLSLNKCTTKNCVITQATRSKCQDCRYRKCVVIGMSKSRSRFGRLAKQKPLDSPNFLSLFVFSQFSDFFKRIKIELQPEVVMATDHYTLYTNLISHLTGFYHDCVLLIEGNKTAFQLNLTAVFEENFQAFSSSSMQSTITCPQSSDNRHDFKRAQIFNALLYFFSIVFEIDVKSILSCCFNHNLSTVSVNSELYAFLSMHHRLENSFNAYWDLAPLIKQSLNLKIVCFIHVMFGLTRGGDENGFKQVMLHLIKSESENKIDSVDDSSRQLIDWLSNVIAFLDANA